MRFELQDVNRCKSGDVGAEVCGSVDSCDDIDAAQSKDWRLSKGLKIEFNCSSCLEGFKLVPQEGKTDARSMILKKGRIFVAK